MNVRTTYQEKADAQLHEWREWIENFKTDPEVSAARKGRDSSRGREMNREREMSGGRDVPLEGRQQMVERLEDSYRIARFRLEELRAAQDETWELTKQAVERAMIDLKKVLDESGAGQAGRLLHLQTNRAHLYEPFAKRG